MAVFGIGFLVEVKVDWFGALKLTGMSERFIGIGERATGYRTDPEQE